VTQRTWRIAVRSAWRRIGAGALGAALLTWAVLLLVSSGRQISGPFNVTFTSADRAALDPVPAVFSVPEGRGPFPAVVLLHSCAGVTPGEIAWARWLDQAGYVTLVVNSLAAWHSPDSCGNAADPSHPVHPDSREVAADALGGLQYLRSQHQIISGRVAVIGWSSGGAAAIAAARARGAAGLPSGPSFKAAVALYPWPCQAVPAGGAAATPLLVLSGGNDVLVPPEECLRQVGRWKGRVAPVDWSSPSGSFEWHMYRGATHEFDRRDEPDLLDRNDRQIPHRYDAAGTIDAHVRVARFLAAHLR
jgi:dienelactone hydrolase